MFENLQKKLHKTFSLLNGKKISDIDSAIVLKEIGKSLIDSDVNHEIVSTFIKRINRQSIGKKILHSLNAKETIVKLVYDELVSLMGGKNIEINFSQNPSIILICGLQGSGKTSFSSKLALFLKRKGRVPLLVAADIYRPAAIDQLKFLSEKINLPIFYLENNQDVLEIISQSIIYSSKNNINTIIIDTAGRLAIDDRMMDELKNISNKFHPNETLLVADSMTGQDAINMAKSFSKKLNFDGIVMTKLDGDSKGGSSITISSIMKKPIKFISNGEKVEDIEVFHPERIASRILGMGDIISFAEKIQEQFNEKKTKNLYQRISKNRFNFSDLLDQIQRFKKMGNIKNIISMIPGLSQYSFMNQNNQGSLKKIESIIYSMTPDERNNPTIIINNIHRKKRISKGSGISLNEVNLFLKQFDNMRKMMKKISPSLGEESIKNFLLKMIHKKNEF